MRIAPPRRPGRRDHGGAGGGAEGGGGRAAAAGLGRPRALLPHRRDREALLHRGDPRRDHGHRELPDAAVGQTVRVLPALHARPGHARGGQGPRRKGGAVTPVRLRGSLHVHVAHAGRAPDLPALQLHPHGALRWGQTAGAPGHPGGRAHQQLPRDRCQGQADRAAAARPAAAGPGGADPEGAELPEVPRGAVPHDQREHQPARALVVHRPDHHPHPHRHLADEAPQELLRGQETGVAPQKHPPGGSPKSTLLLGGPSCPGVQGGTPRSIPSALGCSEGPPNPSYPPWGAQRDPQTHPTHPGVLRGTPKPIPSPWGAQRNLQIHPLTLGCWGRTPRSIPPTPG